VDKKLSEFKLRQLDSSRIKFTLKNLKAEFELDRILSQKFQNPFDVLYLVYDSTEDDIKKAYKNFSIILHPDKCKDERARDAFQVVESAHKTI
jgi:DnaJ homolog subfamily C member 8